MAILKVCDEEKLAPPSLLSSNVVLEYDGLESKYYTFPWDDFFEQIWPKVRGRQNMGYSCPQTYLKPVSQILWCRSSPFRLRRHAPIGMNTSFPSLVRTLIR